MAELEVINELLADEFADFPAWVSVSARNDSQISDGTDISAAFAALTAESVVAVGINCTKPEFVASLLARLDGDVPLIAYPNAGRVWDGENRVWLGDGDQVLPAQAVREWVALGARLVGGCCGLGPAAVSAISAELAAAH